MAGFHCMNGVSQDHKVVQESTDSENIGLLLLIPGLQESQAHSWMKTFNFQVSEHLFVGTGGELIRFVLKENFPVFAYSYLVNLM
jgi:hypothetical protein